MSQQRHQWLDTVCGYLHLLSVSLAYSYKFNILLLLWFGEVTEICRGIFVVFTVTMGPLIFGYFFLNSFSELQQNLCYNERVVQIDA